MQRIWSWAYNGLVIPGLWVAIIVASLFKRKVRRGIRGRNGLLSTLELQTSRLDGQSKRVWFHSSSLGEFEQAKPIIAELKRRRPDVRIIVSFFSPSGYDHSKNYRLADVITYIPFDSRARARAFVKMTSPNAAVIVRYDVWPNHVWALKQMGIPIFLANATMKATSARHLPIIRGFHHAVYDQLDFILTVSESDADAFKRFRLSGPVITPIGDTRYDQVRQRSAESKTRHILPTPLITDRKVIVIGSSWDSDEEVCIPVVERLRRNHPTLLTILVPHEPNVDTIERIERELNSRLSSIRFSDLHDYRGESVIIIDSVGILMPLYQYAHVAYIGGSFRQGIHNVLEPAVYGIPVLFGPVHGNSQEATRLVDEGAAFVGNNEEELYGHFDSLLSDDTKRVNSGTRAQKFVERNTGATKQFLSYLEKVL
jgi:3-deoxy-D-manno-octulosonic-acid transferase